MRIFELYGNGHARQYEGGYTDYLETKKQEESDRDRNLCRYDLFDDEAGVEDFYIF